MTRGFDEQGEHAKTNCYFAGASEDGEPEVIARAEARLEEMLGRLADKRFEDIEIGLFSTECDGHQFGLIDDIPEDEETGEVYVHAKLVPNELVFCDPWDGRYDT